MINKISDGPRLAEKCRRALGSLHCKLTTREKRVIEQIIRLSFDDGQDAAMFGSSDQIAVMADMKKTDVSAALSSLRRFGFIREESANALRHFRRPMLYFLDPAALARVSQEPAVRSGGEFVEKLRAATAKWLAHANRCYPLQPELLPPDPRELDLALAEISRASVLADDLPQNGEPKPAPSGAGEVDPPARTGGPGLTPLPSIETAPEEPTPGGGLDPAYVRTGRALGLSEYQIAQMASRAHPQTHEGATTPVRESLTGIPSLKVSNYSCARDQILSEDNTDRELNSPSENLHGDERGPVRNFLTGGDQPLPFLVRLNTLLAEAGEVWQPPTQSREVINELTRCMGAAVMANFTPWWWPHCVDPESRRDVLETIATWRLARFHPKHKPWCGGTWRKVFYRRQRERLATQGKGAVA